MPYLLDSFERVVEHIGNPKSCSLKSHLNNERSIGQNVTLFDLKQGMLYLATSNTPPQIVGQQIRVYQNSSVRILKKLQESPVCCELSEECNKNVISKMVNTLIGFVNFLHVQFPKDFDSELKVPQLYYERYRKRFKAKLDKIYLLDIESGELEVIKEVVSHFKELGYANCSFRKIWYVDKLLSRITSKVCNNNSTGNNFERLVKVIISYNFNSTEIYNHIIEVIKQNVEKETGIKNKLRKLRCFKKHVSQVMVVKADGFLPKIPSLRTSVVNWLKKELSSYDHEYHLSQENAIVLEAEQPISKTDKVQTSLSVPQIACVVTKCIEVGLILTQNRKETIRIISGVLKSKNNNNISYKSLNNKCTGIDAATYKSTKELFLKLYRSIE
ncbi:hypothetical protein [Saccharicrinis sp. 156]|uniref:hypothetical protein n=1 Tax=Saccharicrinis sp. 156 TaxID=3417574 RepID=UPI003D336894